MADGLLPGVHAQSPDASCTHPVSPSYPPASVSTASMHKGLETHTPVPTPVGVQSPPNTPTPDPTPTGLQTPPSSAIVTPDAQALASIPLMYTAATSPTPAASSPFAAPTPAPRPFCGVSVALVRKGVQMSSATWTPDTLLGSLVSAWAHPHNLSLARICLRHARDDDYLADDVWWDDLGSLAKRWGDAFVVELCVPSQDQVPLLPHSVTPDLICAVVACVHYLPGCQGWVRVGGGGGVQC